MEYAQTDADLVRPKRIYLYDICILLGRVYHWDNRFCPWS